MKRDCKAEVYICACHGEGVSVEKWDENEIYLAFWRVGMYGAYPMSWKQRLRFIWNVLTKGEVWADEVILNNQTAAQLGLYLLSLSQDTSTTVTSSSSAGTVTFTQTNEESKVCPNCNTLNKSDASLCNWCGEEL